MHQYPADILRNNDIVMTSTRRHFDVITSKWRRFHVITTLLLRHVFTLAFCQVSITKISRNLTITVRSICGCLLYSYMVDPCCKDWFHIGLIWCNNDWRFRHIYTSFGCILTLCHILWLKLPLYKLPYSPEFHKWKPITYNLGKNILFWSASYSYLVGFYCILSRIFRLKLPWCKLSHLPKYHKWKLITCKFEK